ncbi:MAG: PIN domain-containing protein [Bacteroidota bacterium]
MTQFFADTDVIIDFLTKRDPFSEEIKQLFQLAAENRVKICVSSVTMVNANYIIGRLESSVQAWNKVEKLAKLVEVLNVGGQTIRLALSSKFRDFEDAVQHMCAKEANLGIIVTRNVKDFKESELSVLTPREILLKIKL